MTSSTDILIVGAGPTGLMFACQLSLHPNISFRIFDKNPTRATESRALVVHARSMEVLSQLNLIDKAMSKGKLVDSMNGFFSGKRAFKMDFTKMRDKQQPLLTRYPYALFLEQSNTEELLETYLNEHDIKVERGIDVMDVTDIDSTNNTGVEVTLSNGDRVRTKYVCACDGAHSTIRHKLNLSFAGQTYSSSLFIADCTISNSPMGQHEAGFFFHKDGFAGIFPMVGDQCRIVATINEEKQKNAETSFEHVSNMVKTRSRFHSLNISNCIWSSVYHSHHRRITTFRSRNRYFLLGDAAHIHSPVGGQGMNTGLQDAHNLAWKLAYVLTHSANDRLLDTYHDERSVVAKTLVNTTDRLFSIMTSNNWFVKFCRLNIVPYILRFFIQPLLNYSQTLRQAAFRRISQTGITYRSDKIYDYGASAGNFHKNTPLPGDRFPYVIFDSCHYHLVIFESQQLTKVSQFIQFIKTNYPEIIQIHDVHKENIPLRFQGAILIRPDGYIAYRTIVFDTNHFRAYFAQYFPQAIVI
ncbi:unnamed protein product [Adineta steineri]|uniref:FAD-binding domain-containing protein n=1 Tax=Adineta steineri TaxID=433720 RepID=A0A813YNT4_9BILA|nr:unnamed protein product [Adineta steineri]CAF1373260.1 unnamed protein product [Adineta steineri]CAF1487906.1 unnamed protein product [Adineta steineri]